MTFYSNPAIVVSSSKEVSQMAHSYVLHDDYETFAKQYLGIDYEDYVNMELGFDETLYEFDEVEYEVPLSV